MLNKFATQLAIREAGLSSPDVTFPPALEEPGWEHDVCASVHSFKVFEGKEKFMKIGEVTLKIGPISV